MGEKQNLIIDDQEIKEAEEIECFSPTDSFKDRSNKEIKQNKVGMEQFLGIKSNQYSRDDQSENHAKGSP